MREQGSVLGRGGWRMGGAAFGRACVLVESPEEQVRRRREPRARVKGSCRSDVSGRRSKHRGEGAVGAGHRGELMTPLAPGRPMGDASIGRPHALLRSYDSSALTPLTPPPQHKACARPFTPTPALPGRPRLWETFPSDAHAHCSAPTTPPP